METKMYVLTINDDFNGVTRIHGVFTSKEGAKQAATKIAPNADYNIFDFVPDVIIY